jgi:AraC-like DNA-binding protein
VKRSVVLVGFQGVQALDLVGPFEVFTGATLCLAGQGRHDDGYDTVTTIAGRCGFGTAETMRRNFVRRMGISPDQYRKTFA